MKEVARLQNFFLIGIGNQPIPMLTAEMQIAIRKHQVFSGGKRHYQLVAPLLPKKHTWIPISGNMETVIHQYQEAQSTIVIFVSGDPFFYGFGNTLIHYLPQANIQSFPYFNSIQRLCHKTQINYNQLITVSVHGRNWSQLDTALIKEAPLIGILTDIIKTPSVIAERLCHYHFNHYRIIVGEALDGNDEVISTYEEPAALIHENHQALNVVLLQQKYIKPTPFGIPDNLFIPLPNRPKMITKMPIRLATLQALHLKKGTCFWDIGTCTGSVAIEAKKHFPEVTVVAFEKRQECKPIIQQNKAQFSTPGIQVIIDDFFNVDLSQYEKPAVIFIGGHGNRLSEMLLKIHQINPQARIVINAVLKSTLTTFITELEKLDYQIEKTTLQVNENNPITICAAQIEA